MRSGGYVAATCAAPQTHPSDRQRVALAQDGTIDAGARLDAVNESLRPVTIAGVAEPVSVRISLGYPLTVVDP